MNRKWNEHCECGWWEGALRNKIENILFYVRHNFEVWSRNLWSNSQTKIKMFLSSLFIKTKMGEANAAAATVYLKLCNLLCNTINCFIFLFAWVVALFSSHAMQQQWFRAIELQVFTRNTKKTKHTQFNYEYLFSNGSWQFVCILVFFLLFRSISTYPWKKIVFQFSFINWRPWYIIRFLVIDKKRTHRYNTITRHSVYST